MVIAHLADIQVRYGKRHDEFRTVFERTKADLMSQKPDRIAVLGDIFHDKVKLSPSSIELVAKFLFDLSDIAPTDVILGNHDLNLKQLEQGDALTPIFEIANMVGRSDKAVVVTEENAAGIDFQRKAIYYYPNSGFFNVAPDLVYGVFSCKDNKMLKLVDKDPTKSYVALWHGTLYGSKMDNGYDATGDGLVNKSTFDGFDAVLMGDIHEYQTFDREHSIEVDETQISSYIQKGWEQKENTYILTKNLPSIAYCGSCLQQGYGESLDKGYLLWDINKQEVDHARRIIPNDHGWSKITISRGESIEERIDNLKFSNNKKKTKVHIVYEDFEESYSIERLTQIKQMVKDKHGCESIHVEFREIEKEILNADDTPQDDIDPDNVEQMLNMFLDDNEFDLADEEERKEFLEFAMRLEREIDIQSGAATQSRKYTLISTEISNVFSFAVEPTFVDWTKLRGITGIFGENYCGKSNLFKALVWGMFQHIMGGAHQKYLVNIYTKSDKGYVQNVYDIDGVLYRSTREVHKGKTSNSYPTKFEVFRDVKDENGSIEKKWCATLSDNTTAENTEVKKMISEALGTYDDFTKISIHAQNEKDGYLNLEQQEKNDLLARYLNLQSYRDRHEYAKKPFNELRAKQKLLGEAVDIELELQGLNNKIKEKEDSRTVLDREQKTWKDKQDAAQEKVLELTRKLHKVEDIGYSSKEAITKEIEAKSSSISSASANIVVLEQWLDVNIMKELGIDLKRTPTLIEKELTTIRNEFLKDKEKYLSLKQWLVDNLRKDVPNTNVEELIKKIESLNLEKQTHQNQRVVFLGKNCPTCKQTTQKADPEGVAKVDGLIAKVDEAVKQIRAEVDAYKNVVEWNKVVDNNETALKTLELSLRSRNTIIESLKTELDNFKKNEEFIETNKLIEKKKAELKAFKTTLEQEQRLLSALQEKASKFDVMVTAKKENDIIEKEITMLQDMIKTYKVSIHSQQTQITALVSEMMLLNSNVTDRNKKLNEVRSGDKLYKMYSIYIQAVERSGIPAMVIKRKLPMVNNKVNSILSSIVGFRVEFSIDMKGNITELFYNTEDKWDALPLTSASGAQQFIVSIAIKDAMNYISKRTIVQPSIIMIDEGFGTLGEELRENVMIMLEYLKNKYQNVMIITHLTEVKEGADHVIEVTRDRSIITGSVHERDEKAGITQISIKR